MKNSEKIELNMPWVVTETGSAPNGKLIPMMCDSSVEGFTLRHAGTLKASTGKALGVPIRV